MIHTEKELTFTNNYWSFKYVFILKFFLILILIYYCSLFFNNYSKVLNVVTLLKNFPTTHDYDLF